MSLEEFFEKIDRHLMEDERPSEYLRQVEDLELSLHFPFEVLHRMRKTKQSSKCHPERSVWTHTLVMTDKVARRRGESTEPRVLMWTTTLHDIGKPDTTRLKHGKAASYNHDREGERLARGFLEIFLEDETFIKVVRGLMCYHIQILFPSERVGLAELEGVKRQVSVREEASLGLCDRLKRDGVDEEKEKRSVREFLLTCAVGEKELG